MQSQKQIIYITKNQLHHVLKKFDPIDQVIIHLRFWENSRIFEIARWVGLSYETVDRRITNLLQQLRHELTGPQMQQFTNFYRISA